MDPRLLVAIAGAETSFATDPNAGKDITTGHNPFGMGPHIQYPTWEAGIEAAAKNLRKNYLNQGLRTVGAIAPKWVGYQSQWPTTVSALMAQLGGGGGAVGPASVPFRTPGWRTALRWKYDWLR